MQYMCVSMHAYIYIYVIYLHIYSERVLDKGGPGLGCDILLPGWEYLLRGVLTGVTPFNSWLIRICAGERRVAAFHTPNAVAQ